MAFADDLLYKVSKGVLNENTIGVKVLSLEEMQQVKGGYRVEIFGNGSQWSAATENYAVAIPDIREFQKGGVCALGQLDCAAPSQRRLTEWLTVTNGALDLFPTYIVKRSVQVSSLGQRYVLFTYGVGVVDQNLQLYRINSSAILNNNMVINEIRREHKTRMENNLGGWTVGR